MKPFSLATALGTFLSTSQTVSCETRNFDDALHQTVADLYLFRHDLDNIQKQGLPNKIEHSLNDFSERLATFTHTSFVVSDDHVSTLLRIGLVANSITFSLSRMVGLLEQFNEHKKTWKKESTATAFAACKKVSEALYAQYTVMKSEDAVSVHVGEKLEDLNKTLTTLQKSFDHP